MRVAAVLGSLLVVACGTSAGLDSSRDGGSDPVADGGLLDPDGRGAGPDAAIPGAVPDAPIEPPDDCDPDGPIHPGAEEIIDGVDNDCDGLVDEIEVCAGGGTPFTSLGAAIDAAPSGGTILVCAGIYSETLTIAAKPLHLIGVAGPDATAIDAGDSGTAVTVGQTGGTGLTIEGFTIRNGATGGEGGGIRCVASTLRIVDSVVISNVAHGGGGLYATGCALDIDRARFEQNDGGETGGGAMLVASSGQVRSSTFVSNTAVRGGGLYGLEGSVNLVSNVFRANSAQLHGGGVYHESDAAFSGNSVLSNRAGWTGGGVQVVAHAPTIDANTISDNTAVDDGGGLYVDQSAARIADNVVTGNTTGDDGGGIRIFESALRLERNRVEGNSAGDAGGGIKISHVPCEVFDNIVRNNFSGNTAGGMDLDNDSSHVRGGEISGNTAASSGGGVFVSLGAWNGHTLENIVISGNRAWRGAGLFVDDNFMPVTMRGLRVVDNIAGKGAGLHIRATNYSLTNSLFEGNVAYERGGALLAGVNSAWWMECTRESPCPPLNPIGSVDYVVFRGNDAPAGSAVWTDSAGLSVENSILFENDRTAVTVAAPEATPGAISPPQWRYNDTQPATFVGMGDPTGSNGNIAADPQFMDMAGGDFHLGPGSQCVDAADPALVDPDGSRADMGMFGGSQ